MKNSLLLAAVLALVLGSAHGAQAQTEITLIGPGGVRAAVTKLIPGFEAKTGNKVKGTFGSGLGTKAQVIKGDVFDVTIVQPPLKEVTDSGNVVASTETPLATVAVGVAVKKGAPKPDISTADAVKKMLLAAKSISYPNPAGGAAAGVSFDNTLKQLGIFEEIKSKTKLGQGGAGSMAFVANGEVEIGLTFMSEMENPGIDIVGTLPTSISTPTGLVAYVHTKAKDPKAAKALVDYLSGPEAAHVYHELRMVPGR
jgi:molybdate transport system substrate-binding protein